MQKKAYLSIISAAALWGCIGVFLRLLTAAGLDSMESVAVRSTVAAILYFFWLLFTDRAAVRVRLQDLWYFVGTGIFSVLFFNWCYFNAISLSALSVAALIGIFAFHEAVTPYKLLGMAAIFGAILILNRRP